MSGEQSAVWELFCWLASLSRVVARAARRTTGPCAGPTPPSPNTSTLALSYSLEGATALANTYIPLLTYAHASGKAGTELIPGLAESLPKIDQGGRRYTLQLRPGLKYSDGTPVRASDFGRAVERLHPAQLAGLALLHEHRRRRRVRGNQEGRHSGDREPTTRAAGSSSTCANRTGASATSSP